MKDRHTGSLKVRGDSTVQGDILHLNLCAYLSVRRTQEGKHNPDLDAHTNVGTPSYTRTIAR